MQEMSPLMTKIQHLNYLVILLIVAFKFPISGFSLIIVHIAFKFPIFSFWLIIIIHVTI